MNADKVKKGMRVGVVDHAGRIEDRGKVLEVLRNGYVVILFDSGPKTAIAARNLVRLVPKRRKPRELWVNFYKKGPGVPHLNPETAKLISECYAKETAVHFREVIE